MKEYKTILVEKHDFIGKIIYNQPEKRNPMNSKMIEEATDAFDDFEKDPGVKVIIVTHNGPVFHSGMPMKELYGKSYEEILKVSKNFDNYSKMIQRDITKPVISVGYGRGPTQWADIIILSDKAQYATRGIDLGLVCGATRSGAFLVGFKRNKRMVLSGDIISAQQALDWGYVDVVVPHDKLEETAMMWAKKMAQKSPIAFRLIKRALWETRNMTPEEAWSYLEEIFCRHAASEAGQDAIKAFIEKRTPPWLAD